jgi:hypothetical protein
VLEVTEEESFPPREIIFSSMFFRGEERLPVMAKFLERILDL